MTVEMFPECTYCGKKHKDLKPLEGNDPRLGWCPKCYPMVKEFNDEQLWKAKQIRIDHPKWFEGKEEE